MIIDVSRDEYEKLLPEIKKEFVKYSEKFIQLHPRYAGKVRYFDEMYSENFAALNKNEDDGLCVFLNRETMLCGVYENRPQVCRDYTTDRCENIRLII